MASLLEKVVIPKKALFLEPVRFNAVCGSGSGGLVDRLGAAFDLVFPSSGNGCVTHWLEFDVVVHAGNPLLAALTCLLASRSGLSVGLVAASNRDEWPYDLAATPEFLSVVCSASGFSCTDLHPASVCMSMALCASSRLVRFPSVEFGLSRRSAEDGVLSLILNAAPSGSGFDDGYGFFKGIKGGIHSCPSVEIGNSGSLAVFCKRLVLTSSSVMFSESVARNDELGQRLGWGSDLISAVGSAGAAPSSGENAAKLALETVLSVSRLF
ncbi:hypothetical protein [Roseibium sp. RKSG952]|uniref:hypothetical protein n=1 Tax=Roseibium sp. RKSG952 TaxID=2529384 RepID=UPI0012BB6F4A|nr:hypothetical protein [Roseibium sp. RKSG952]MTH97595.1 hypothetical protein [Roseibium sp. RKSG952]